MREGKTLEEMRKQYLPKKGRPTKEPDPPPDAEEREGVEDVGAIIDSMRGKEGETRREQRKRVDLSAMHRSGGRRSSAKYVIRRSSDPAACSDDAILQFGRYSGRMVSELAEDKDGLSYLEWILRESFPPELKDIIRTWVHAATARARGKGLGF